MNDKELMAIKIADYIIGNNASIREVCGEFQILSPRTARAILKRLCEIDDEKYQLAYSILSDKENEGKRKIVKHDDGYERLTVFKQSDIELANNIADYIIENHATSDMVCEKFKLKKYHISKIISKHLNNINIEKYKKVKEIMKENQLNSCKSRTGKKLKRGVKI